MKSTIINPFRKVHILMFTIAASLLLFFAIGCGGDSQSAESAESTEATTVHLDLPTIANHSAADVEKILGAPSKKEEISGKYPCTEGPCTHAFYKGEEIEIYFIDGKSNNITINNLAHLPFKAGSIKAFNLPESTPAFENANVIKWANVGGYAEIAFFPDGKGNITYALVKVN